MLVPDGIMEGRGSRASEPPLPLLCSLPSHDAERTGAAMNFLDDLRAEWIAIRKSLGDHIAYLEAGNKIHPIDQDPTKRQQNSWHG